MIDQIGLSSSEKLSRAFPEELKVVVRDTEIQCERTRAAMTAVAAVSLERTRVRVGSATTSVATAIKQQP